MSGYDLIVIGAGPGGYTGAIRAAQLGLNTAVIERHKEGGGTCLNVGCIPSKCLLESSEHYMFGQHEAAEHGLQIKDLQFDVSTMIKRKQKIVSELTGGIEFLFKKNKITRLHGTARIEGAGQVTLVKDDGQEEALTAQNIMIATGSYPISLPGMDFDGEHIISSTHALSLSDVPKSLVVVGGGVIGLELGSVWARLGSEVTVIEFLDHIGGPIDKRMGKQFQKILEKQGMKFLLSTKVTSVDTGGDQATVHYEGAQGGNQAQIKANKVMVCVGRRPYTQGLGLEKAGIAVDEGGRIVVDDHFRTNLPGVFAIGDVIRGPMLAHKAEEEGVAVAELIKTGYGHVNYDTVPSVIYTWPEMAWVGLNEEQAKEQYGKVKVGSFAFTANGRARSLGCTDGQVKIIAHPESDKVIGVHILGPRASDMLAEAVVAMEFGASSEDIARSFHAHPTLSEVMREAALAVDGRARQS